MSLPKRLYRNPAAGRIGGVCAGLADYFEIDVALVRLAWIVLSIVPGGFIGGLLAYLGAWIVVPDGPESAAARGARRLVRSTADRKPIAMGR